MNIDKSTKLGIVATGVLLIIASVFFYMNNSFNRGVSPANPNEDSYASHSTDEDPQLVIYNSEALQSSVGDSIFSSVRSQLYAAHYEKYSILNREAELIGREDVDDDTVKFSVKFQPSGNIIDAEITVNNQATKDYDLKISGGSDE